MKTEIMTVATCIVIAVCFPLFMTTGLALLLGSAAMMAVIMPFVMRSIR